jgi:hypothetical protein
VLAYRFCPLQPEGTGKQAEGNRTVAARVDELLPKSTKAKPREELPGFQRVVVSRTSDNHLDYIRRR